MKSTIFKGGNTGRVGDNRSADRRLRRFQPKIVSRCLYKMS